VAERVVTSCDDQRPPRGLVTHVVGGQGEYGERAQRADDPDEAFRPRLPRVGTEHLEHEQVVVLEHGRPQVRGGDRLERQRHQTRPVQRGICEQLEQPAVARWAGRQSRGLVAHLPALRAARLLGGLVERFLARVVVQQARLGQADRLRDRRERRVREPVLGEQRGRAVEDLLVGLLPEWTCHGFDRTCPPDRIGR
jgi:hypothetical protein